ncbi:hypothetical protein ZYGR_0AL01960 [Zygosaccharomyces rouxii]|uniref:Large ribosomal subunit protein bL27m n=1 Tax=Zygosaccharomyces rouxii TaxID=4956 RepID=A0A1Q3AFE6_ZYGRO|nr:hypothetical protein ZYGR_0AL01960 [Zygosaccharomyces rouxii]
MVVLTNYRGGFVPKYACNILTQVRNATKRAAGSRTSMKDSAGRRLGPKKYEGQSVKVGEIIMRQRGTKLYPGENTGIGKDHTIFAKEPGVVRYYVDPFHPKRKFVGVSLKRELKLPLPHFAPRVRRFGREILTHPRLRAEEEAFLPRKQLEAKDSILKALQERESKRVQLSEDFRKFLEKQLPEVQLKDVDMANAYLIRLRSCIKNGYELEDAQYNAHHYLELEYSLQSQRENWSDRLEWHLQTLQETVDTLNKSVSFDNKLCLMKYIDPQTKESLKSQFIKTLQEKAENIATKQQREEIKSLFQDACQFLTLSEEVHLRRQFLKPVKPEVPATLAPQPSKNTITIKRFNHERNRLETIPRTKTAFLSKL